MYTLVDLEAGGDSVGGSTYTPQPGGGQGDIATFKARNDSRVIMMLVIERTNEEMTEKELKKELEDTKNKWLKKEKGKTEEERNEMLICKNLELLKQYQKQYPDGFEKYYWDNYRCMEQDNVYMDSYSKIIDGIGFIIANAGMTFSAFSLALSDKIQMVYDWKTLIIYFAFVATFLIAVYLIILYFSKSWNTRERSYYKIFVAMMADLKNAEKTSEMDNTETDNDETAGKKSGRS